MSGNRMGRINEDIQRELSLCIRRMKDPRVKGVVSVTAVDTTADLKYARIYISVLDREDAREVIKGLKSAAGWLRRELGGALTLRYTPELVFLLDESVDRGAKIFHILKEIERKESEDASE